MVKREVVRQTPRSIPMLLFYIAHIVAISAALVYVIYHDSSLHLWLVSAGFEYVCFIDLYVIYTKNHEKAALSKHSFVFQFKTRTCFHFSA